MKNSGIVSSINMDIIKIPGIDTGRLRITAQGEILMSQVTYQSSVALFITVHITTDSGVCPSRARATVTDTNPRLLQTRE